MRQLRGCEVPTADGPHEVGLLGEDTGTLPTLDLEYPDGKSEHCPHEPDGLKEVRVIGDDDCDLVLAGEAIDQ